jgi:hypothetical protein
MNICKSMALVLRKNTEDKNKINHNDLNINNQTNIDTQNNIDNSTNNNNNNNTINSNNNQTINNFIITYKPTNMEFKTDHISNGDLKKIIKLTHQSTDDEKKVHMLEEFLRNLLSNPENRCIQKTNMQNCFSRVHAGNDLWQVKHDKDVYPKFTCNIAEELNYLMVKRNEETQMIKTERKLNELRAFLDYMADFGYRNDEDNEINRETHLMFKQLVQRIKGVVFDMTKIRI